MLQAGTDKPEKTPSDEEMQYCFSQCDMSCVRLFAILTARINYSIAPFWQGFCCCFSCGGLNLHHCYVVIQAGRMRNRSCTFNLEPAGRPEPSQEQTACARGFVFFCVKSVGRNDKLHFCGQAVQKDNIEAVQKDAHNAYCFLCFPL